ncbi:Protein REVEILLE 2 [Dichanthelium oligosanthes]|uniref:Protein REVEILLE 2 n=1 Tax=Dichanthelium oligosanthes TaxID=888268 RepID=A0A1E5WE16_9POAL|nr:Protein REVEILLE 2 [Dichanthelium oligosanthes]
MASMAQVEERDGLDSSGLPIEKMQPVDDAMQSKEGMDGYPVKARKPYTITKQREKWTEEEHEKFLEALKLYGRSWRQIQEHIGTKTAVQIRSHAQKFFSKVVREPGASNAIEIPPPRPKRKPLHPYPRKCADSSTVANPGMGQPKLASHSSSSGSDQENSSPVSVLSAMQSDAFGSSVSNPSMGCMSPASSDDGNNAPALVNGEGNLLAQQIEDDQSRQGQDMFQFQEIKQDNSDGDLSEEDLSEGVQETSLKLFGKTVIIPDPKKICSSDGGCGDGEKSSESSKQEVLQASSIGGIAAYPAHNGWLLPYHSFPFHMGEAGDARISPLRVWWPYYGFPVGHPRGFGTGLHTEGTCESDTGKSPAVESSSDCVGNVQTMAPTNCKVVKESLEAIQVAESALSFELKPSLNSAFVRVKPSSSRGQSVRGFVPYKRCKVE